jgi:hypothetical protein
MVLTMPSWQVSLLAYPLRVRSSSRAHLSGSIIIHTLGPNERVPRPRWGGAIAATG